MTAGRSGALLGAVRGTVDVNISYDLKGKRTKQIQLVDGPIQILGLRELIKMKRESARPQDMEDVRALEQLL